MANWIITNNRWFFEKIGDYNYVPLSALDDLPEIIGYDSETTSLKPRHGHMFAIQISDGRGNNFLIDMQQLGGEIVFDDVRPYLEGKVLVGHNLTFDLGWLYKHDFWPEKVWDTFIASKLLYNGYHGWFRHGFAHVMERELGALYDKSEQKNIAKVQLSTAKAIQYCFNDVDRIIELMQALGKKLRAGGFVDTYKLHCRYIRALAYTEQCGLPVSKKHWLAKMEADKQESQDAQQAIHDYIYEHLPQYRDLQGNLFSGFERRTLLNLASTKQMIPVFEEFGIDIYSEDTASGKSIQEDIIRRSPHEFVPLWLRYVHAEHSITTFGQKIIDGIGDDGRIYTSFNPILDTARISTRKGEINFLNFPGDQRTRECFRVAKGKMVVCDYDGQENVVGADLHNDPVMVASINEGLDLHCAFARVLFPEELENLSDDEIKDNHPHLRKQAKSPRFAFAYGGSGYTVAKAQNIPVEEGNEIEYKFRELHKGVYTWGKRVLEEAVEKGYIESADGFKLHLPDYKEWKEAKDKLDSRSKDFWDTYRIGKEQYQMVREAEEQGEVYEVPKVFKREYQFYLHHKQEVSYVYRKLGKYSRLCLNNPVQTTSAHQTKLAVCLLFEEILARGDQWKARICNIPHDEVVMEVTEDDLVEDYEQILTSCMLTGGEYYMRSGLVKMGAEAHSGESWYEAK